MVHPKIISKFDNHLDMMGVVAEFCHGVIQCGVRLRFDTEDPGKSRAGASKKLFNGHKERRERDNRR